MSLTYPIPRQTRQAILTAGAGQTVFGPMDFRLYNVLDVEVRVKASAAVEWTLLSPDQYTTSPVAPDVGFPAFFTITFLTGRDAGDTVWIKGSRLPQRTTDVTRGGVIKSQSLEGALDRFVATEQEIRRDVDALIAGGALHELIASGIANNSYVSGGTVSAALETLQTLIDALGVLGFSGFKGFSTLADMTAANTLPDKTLGIVSSLTDPANAGTYVSTAGVWTLFTRYAPPVYDLTGEASSSGTSYTAGTLSEFTMTPGALLIFTPPVTNTGGVQLKVNSLAFYQIRDAAGLPIPEGLLQQNKHHLLIVETSTQFRALTLDPSRSLVSAPFVRNGIVAALLSVTSLNELSISSWVSGALAEVAHFDAASGNLRAINDVGYGATPALFTAYFSPKNLPPFVLNDASAQAMSRAISGAATREHIDQVAPYALTTTTPYYLNGGDGFKDIYVSVNNAYCDARFTPIGGFIEIWTAPAASKSVSIYCGADATWRGFAADQKTLTITNTQIVRVHRKSSTDYFLEVVEGAVASSSNAAPPARDKTFVMLGQSNGVRLINGGGLAGIQERWAELNLTEKIWWVNAAVGASALMMGNESATNNYWWDAVAGTPGPRATEAMAAINAAVALGQPAPSMLFWDQGEQDSSAMATSGATTPTTYLAAMGALFSWFRTQLSNATLKIVIVPLGADDTAATDRGKTAVREAQLKYIASDANAYQGPERYDLPRPAGDVHQNYAGQRMEGRRLVDVVSNLIYGKTNNLGPQILSCTSLTASTFKVIVAPGPGSASLSNVDNPVGAVGFRMCSNADAMAATLYTNVSIIRAFNAGTGNHEFTITIAESDAAARLIYPYGALALGRTDRIVKGTVSTKPLRSWNGTP